VVFVGGVPGSGKSAVKRALIASMDRDASIVLVTARGPDLLQLLSQLLDQLGPSLPYDDDKSTMLAALSGSIRSRREGGRPFVVIIDDAHVLSSEALGKLCTIGGVHLFLFGEPELLDRVIAIDDPSVRTHLMQTCYLKPLSREESVAHLARRGGAVTFTPAAISRIVTETQGLAGSLERLATACLAEAATTGAPEVGPEIVERVLTGSRARPVAHGPPDRLPVERKRPPRRERKAWRALLLIGAGTAVAALTFLWLSVKSKQPTVPWLRTVPAEELAEPAARRALLQTVPAEKQFVTDVLTAKPEVPLVIVQTGPVAEPRATQIPAPEPVEPQVSEVGAESDAPRRETESLYFVQVGAYRSRENAEVALKKLVRVDEQATLRVGSQLLYVATRGFPTKAEAEAYETELESLGFATVLRSP
jgi:type II secretory pathway predicted ATPase ExeA